MIKYLVMDVDGSLTDGKIYMGMNGESHKAFSVKDGYVFNYILKPNNIEPIIITARDSQIVKNRCKELGIEKIYQGKLDKLTTLIEIVGEDNLGQCAYFGDDILDLKCMLPIREQGGIVGCPIDAVKEVKLASDYVCDSKAGEGALREFVEWLTMPRVSKEVLAARINEAISYIRNLDTGKMTIGKYVVDDTFYYVVQEYNTRTVEHCELESHRKYVDIQFIIEGSEIIQVAHTSSLSQLSEYCEENDVAFWKTPSHMMSVLLQSGSYIVLYPQDAHMGCIMNGQPVKVRKVVGKVRV